MEAQSFGVGALVGLFEEARPRVLRFIGLDQQSPGLALLETPPGPFTGSTELRCNVKRVGLYVGPDIELGARANRDQFDFTEWERECGKSQAIATSPTGLRLWVVRHVIPSGTFTPDDVTVQQAREIVDPSGRRLSDRQIEDCDQHAAEPWDEIDWPNTMRDEIDRRITAQSGEFNKLVEYWESTRDILDRREILSFLVEDLKRRNSLGYLLIVADDNAADALKVIFSGTGSPWSIEEMRGPQGPVAALLSGYGKRNAKIAGTEWSWLKKDEVQDDFLRRVAVPSERIVSFAKTVARHGSIKGADAFLERRNRPTARLEFVIEKLLPRGALSIMVGAPKIGKSTVALQLALDVAIGRPVFGALPVPAGDGLVLFISGEDSEAVVGARGAAMLGGDELPDRFMQICETGKIEDILAQYENARVDLVVIDTAARFIQGSVSDGGHVRAFLDPIDRFIKRANAAALILHHVNKPGRSGSPRTAEAVLAAMKGSSEFLSAPRVFIAFFSDSADRVLQIPRVNLLASVDMQREPMRLAYDPSTERHAPSAEPAAQAAGKAQPSKQPDGEASAKPVTNPDDDARAIARVILAAVSAGRKAPKTGQGEPYTWRDEALANWPRARVRAAHARAAELGLLSAPPAPDAATGAAVAPQGASDVAAE